MRQFNLVQDGLNYGKTNDGSRGSRESAGESLDNLAVVSKWYVVFGL
jgi:hypothetical protein